MKVSAQNMTRWAQFEFEGNCIGLFNQKYDDDEFENGENIDDRYSKEYLKVYKNKETRYGNNIVLNFWIDDLDEEYNRIKTLEIGEMSNIILLNTAGEYYFFTLDDPDGNVIEITGNYNK